MNNIQQAKSLLKNVFGYENFRPLQQEIIECVLKKQDATVIMPTGGGKSLCYQVPALIFPGLTIVISPLISLMTDQVNQMTKIGVAAACLNSSLEFDQYQMITNEVLHGDIKILYLAPETLLKDNTINILSQVKIDLFAVDEAHCVSEWGHDFRPEYRQIAKLRKKLGSPVCLGLTATATQRVRKDISKTLKLINSKQFIASFDRKNLYLEIIDKTDVDTQILDFLQDHHNQSGIVYCFSRKKVEQVNELLKKNGYSVLPYHAGLESKERNRNQELFIRDEVQIIVATIAFGMGIDKPNVRFVIHADLPKNMESYYQEIGRAGRDGQRSECLLLFSAGDSGKIQHFIREKPDQKERQLAHEQLDQLVAYANTHKCRRGVLLKYFNENHSRQNCNMCDNCINPKQQQDLSIEAQKYLSCIYRTEQRFGANYIIDILLGSRNKRILEYKHENLSTWGIGKDLSRNQWKSLSQLLLSEDIIFCDSENYNILSIAPKGYLVLKKEIQVMGTLAKKLIPSRPAATIAAKSLAANNDLEHDVKLFEKLRKHRLELARKNSMAPYMIFNDRSLIEMCHLMPVTADDFLLVTGVGNSKLEKYGNAFMDLIIQHQKTQELSTIK